jgi:hypothetical protein
MRPIHEAMLLVVVALLCLALALATGGSLAALADVRLRAPWLVGLALGAQVVIVSIVPGSFDGLHAPVHIATYGLLGAFLWCNRRLPGLVFVAAGCAANAAAIIANGGVMPATAGALAAAGMPAEKTGEFANSAVVESSALSWLGDVFAVPASWPLSNVFSIGDVLVAAGLTIALAMLSGSRLGRISPR